MKVCKYKGMLITTINTSKFTKICKIKPLQFAYTVHLCPPYGSAIRQFPT